MKKSVFLLLIVVALAGFVSANSATDMTGGFGLDAVLSGDIAEFFNVTPDTVSVISPLYAEIATDIETNSIENEYISGGLPLRGSKRWLGTA